MNLPFLNEMFKKFLDSTLQKYSGGPIEVSEVVLVYEAKCTLYYMECFSVYDDLVLFAEHCRRTRIILYEAKWHRCR
jgi:hypothetical protein